MLRFCRLPDPAEDDSESEPNSSGGLGFQIKEGPLEADDEKGGNLSDDENDRILPLWEFDPEKAPTEDLEELSEVRLLRMLSTHLLSCDRVALMLQIAAALLIQTVS